MPTDVKTDMTKLIVALRSFTKAPERGIVLGPSLWPKYVILFQYNIENITNTLGWSVCAFTAYGELKYFGIG